MQHHSHTAIFFGFFVLAFNYACSSVPNAAMVRDIVKTFVTNNRFPRFNHAALHSLAGVRGYYNRIAK
jgi:hypothetical protein